MEPHTDLTKKNKSVIIEIKNDTPDIKMVKLFGYNTIQDEFMRLKDDEEDLAIIDFVEYRLISNPNLPQYIIGKNYKDFIQAIGQRETITINSLAMVVIKEDHIGLQVNTQEDLYLHDSDVFTHYSFRTATDQMSQSVKTFRKPITLKSSETLEFRICPRTRLQVYLYIQF